VVKKILIVEDNEDIRFLYKRMFRKEKDIQIEEATSGETALDIIMRSRPDLMLIDISLPGISGLDLTKKVRTQYPETRILIVTGHDISRYYDDAIKNGADDLISKEIGKDIVGRCRRMMNI
jgi:DNA-binding NarL/FixJ family response regulator